jgi:TP901 family phage tail tape measure protein
MARDLKLQVVLQGLDRVSKPFRDAGRSAIGLGRDLKATRTELKGLQAQQSDISSFRALKGQTEQTGKALQASREKVRQLAREIGAAGAPTKALNQQYQRAIREATALKAKHGEQQTALQGLRGKLNAAGISTRNLGQHERDLKARITATNQAMAQQEARLKRITAQQQRLARAKQQYEKTQALAGSMAGTGAGGLATGSGILYAGARMFAPGVQFDSDMSKVQALTRLGKDDAQLAAMRAQARQLGADTMFSATDAAQGQGYLAMAGFKPEDILAAMPDLLDVAKAGDSELADTADIVSNILTGFNLKATETSRLGDVLVGAFTRSNTNLQMLGETMKYAGPVAASVGQDIETVAAMAGKLGDAGIQGSMGGTALRAIINRLSAPPKAAAKALEKLGISASDADGNLRDLPTVLQEVFEKTKALGDTERAGLLKGIAGDEAVAGLQVLVAQAGSGELQKFIGTLRQTRGEAAMTAKVMGDNLVGDLDELSSAWEDLGIQLYTQQNGPLRGIAQGITKVIGSVKTWVAENPKLASQLVKTAAGLGIVMAGMGGLTLAMASILGPFAMVRYGLMLFGIRGAGLASTLFSLGKVALPLVATGLRALAVAAMANPILALITGIVVGAALIYEHWDGISAFFGSVWSEIKMAFDGGLVGIAGLLLKWNPLNLFRNAFTGVMNYFGIDMPARFSEFGGFLVQGLIDGFTSMFPRVTALISGAADSIITTFKGLLGIHSPSRVFAELGGYTMQGYGQGLLAEQSNPLSALQRIGNNLVAAGSQTIGGQVAFDARAPLAAAGAGGNTGRSIVVEGDTIHISIEGGGDIASMRRMLEQLLNERERAKAARMRSALYDQE